MKLDQKKIISIIGPTGVGKTLFSVELAKKIESEIVSFDSRQFYKELQIGSGIPSKHEMKGIKHHFIGNKSIIESYSVGDFEIDALKTIEKLFKKYSTVVIVGGSGLYEKAIIEGFHKIPKIPLKIREKIMNNYEKFGLQFLQNELKEKDWKYFKKVDINNSFRMIRALEVIEFTGKSILFFQNLLKKNRNFRIKKIGLDIPKHLLHEVINQRVDHMIVKGLIEEARSLIPYKNYNALKTIGYTELFSYFNSEISLDLAIKKIKKNSRKYAKRQLTWFKKDKNIEWIDFPFKVYK